MLKDIMHTVYTYVYIDSNICGDRTWNHMRMNVECAFATQDLPSPPPLFLLDVPFPDIETVPVSPCLCPPRGLKIFTHKSTALPRLCLPNGLLTFTHKSTQDVLASAPLTFPHKSTAPPRLCLPPVTLPSLEVNTNVLSKCAPKNVLPKCTVKFISKASSPLTSCHSGQALHCSTSLSMVQYSRSCELDTATLPWVLYVERPLWAGFARGTVSHSRPAQRCHTRNSNSLLSCLWRKCPVQLSSSLPRCHHILCFTSFLPSP